jgi:predicted Rossmann fold flavoprotein
MAAMASKYPRGSKVMKKLLGKFSALDMYQWLEKRGVVLKVEEDGRVFPVSNSSQTIINCFLDACDSYGIETYLSTGDVSFSKSGNKFTLSSRLGTYSSAKVIVATGGGNKLSGYTWLHDLGHEIVAPLPSLFTLNIPHSPFKNLGGIAVDGGLRITGTKWEEDGPILITHWGLSGPAVLRLSAFAAAYFHEKAYQTEVQVRWIARIPEEEVRNFFLSQKSRNPKRKISKYPEFSVPRRLWEVLCALADIREEAMYGELGHKNLRKLTELLLRFPLQVDGKTTFKEEFVTCGGVAWSEVNTQTMESKHIAGLYFAGEVLNVDGITGGFNFQAAWSTADAAARGAAGKV